MTWKEILKAINWERSGWQFKNENLAHRPQDGAILIFENGRDSEDYMMSKKSQPEVLNAYKQYSTLPNPTFESITTNDAERARFMDWTRHWSWNRGTDWDWMEEHRKTSYAMQQYQDDDTGLDQQTTDEINRLTNTLR